MLINNPQYPTPKTKGGEKKIHPPKKEKEEDKTQHV